MPRFRGCFMVSIFEGWIIVVYYAAVLIGRITDLARPSVLYGLLTLEQNGAKTNEIGANLPKNWDIRRANEFSVQKAKGQGCGCAVCSGWPHIMSAASQHLRLSALSSDVAFEWRTVTMTTAIILPTLIEGSGYLRQCMCHKDSAMWTTLLPPPKWLWDTWRLVVRLLVCLLAALHTKLRADLPEIFREG